jgi:arginase family enzyme
MKIVTLETNPLGDAVHEELSKFFEVTRVNVTEHFIPAYDDINGLQGETFISPLIELMKGVAPEGTICAGTSGEFHHLTFGICANLNSQLSYVHIDNHEDRTPRSSGDLFINYGNPGDQFIDCGNFVQDIDSLPNIDKVYWNEMPEGKDVYLSVDLDVLSKDYINTRYDQGDLTPEQLIEQVSRIKSTNNIISADIFGYTSGPVEFYKEIIEAITE